MELTAQRGQTVKAGFRPCVGIVLLGLAIALLYTPVYWELSQTIWSTDEHFHEPLVLLIAGWLAWTSRDMLEVARTRGATVFGVVSLLVGLLSYLLGRTQDILILQVGSQIPVFLGILAIVAGWGVIKTLWFPLLYLGFMLPLPSFVVDSLTAPLKQQVSLLAESLLYGVGYPIARSGVVLSVGQYQLLVADACSGLHSLLSMAAMGLLYIRLMGYRSLLRNFVLVASLLPIGFAANVVRVIVLVLVTYHFGDEAGQGFVHDSAGVVLFVAALLLLFALDAVLGMAGRFFGRDRSLAVIRPPPGTSTQGSAPATTAAVRSAPPVGLGISSVIGVAAVLAAVAAVVLKPAQQVDDGTRMNLEELIPASFGDWRVDPSIIPILPSPDVQAALDKLYSQTVARTYVNSQGQRVMLSVAYGAKQTDSLRVHQPEGCYTGQGFHILSAVPAEISMRVGTLPVTRLVAAKGQRNEPITYWMRIGDSPARTQWEMKKAQLRYGLSGRIPDGLLVRVSNISSDMENSFALHKQFVESMLEKIGPERRVDVVGRLPG